MQIRIQGRTISFESAGKGIPLLLMHAFPLNQSMFQPQREHLADQAQLLTFDVPGAGGSEPGPTSMDDIADIAAAGLDSQNIEKAVIGGVSMGGYAAFSFARKHPARLRGLILANTRAAADTEQAKAGRRETAEAALREGSEEIARRMLPRLLSESTHANKPDVVKTVRTMAAATRPETIAALLRALGDRCDSSDLLSEIKVPALVIAGADDSIAPPDEAASWAEQIPDCRFVKIDHAGHLANLEQPEAFNAAVANFLRERISA